MRRILWMVFLFIAGSLFAQFNDLVKLNSYQSRVYYRGKEACKVVGNEIYITYVELYPSSNLIFAYSADAENFTNLIVDENIMTNKRAIPTIEVFPDGQIIIFYIKEIDFIFNLLKATSTDNGVSFEIESIETMVTEFSTYLDGNELYLTYKKGDSVSFSYYNYFTNKEASENADGGLAAAMVKFWGPDVLWGPVHSNSDIYIQQAGGGYNNEWPTFHGPVTTAGIVRVYPSGAPAFGNCPIEDIFLGGLEEHIIPTILPATAEELSSNAIQVGEGYDIVYVKMNGTTCQTMFGAIIYPNIQEFNVYSWYPDSPAHANVIIANNGNWYEDSNLIYQNQLNIPDTVWVNGPSYDLPDNCFWVEDAVLWIEGEVNGNTTWGCANNVYITSDIYYTNTPLGEPPDEPGNMNPSDYFGLVSEKKIFLKYKHKDPFNNFELRADNCDDVYLYGAYAAIGLGDESIYGIMACHHDGILTFEYQHPHGSTPNFNALSPYTMTDTTYTYLDLHKFIFPIDSNLPEELLGFNLHSNDPVYAGTSGFPYESSEYLNSYPNNDPQNYVFPYGADYPWYNPVYPESSDDIVFDRGEMKLWGSIIQRRRGFMHRSGTDPYNHPGDNDWDLENYHYGGDHASIGYYRTCYYDSRFEVVQPNYFPTGYNGNVNSTLFITCSFDGGNNFEVLSSAALDDFEPIYSLVSEGDLVVAITHDPYPLRLQLSIDHGISFTEHIVEMPVGELKNVDVINGLLYFYYHCPSDENKIIEFDPTSLDTLIYQTFIPPENLSNFAVSHNHEKVYASLFDYSLTTGVMDIEFDYSINQGNSLDQIYHWQSNWTEYMSFDYSELDLHFDQNDYVYSIISYISTQSLGACDLYLAKGFLPDLTTGSWDNEIPKPQKITLSNYPNPFNPSTTISFSVTQTYSFATIEIFNLKGQKVKTFTLDCSNSFAANARDSRSTYSVTWDGTDDNNKPVSSGIYFYKLKSGNFEKTKKCLLMK